MNSKQTHATTCSSHSEVSTKSASGQRSCGDSTPHGLIILRRDKQEGLGQVVGAVLSKRAAPDP